jgi:hypothetical protein
MKLKDVAIVVVWIFFLRGAFANAIAMGHLHIPPGTVAPFPPTEVWFVALPLFFSVVRSACFSSGIVSLTEGGCGI